VTFLWVIPGCGSSAEAAEAADPRFPSGYAKYWKVVLKQHVRIYGERAYSTLLLAQVEQESGWRRCVTSPAGARGMMQFMPQTQAGVERESGFRGNICDPEHAARLQAWLMRENAKWCGPRFDGFRPVWFCTLRIYNGSPAAFACEHKKCGLPRSTDEVEPCSCRKRAFWIENTRYPRYVFARWPKYLERHGR
jgi:hypothetical protein